MIACCASPRRAWIMLNGLRSTVMFSGLVSTTTSGEPQPASGRNWLDASRTWPRIGPKTSLLEAAMVLWAKGRRPSAVSWPKCLYFRSCQTRGSPSTTPGHRAARVALWRKRESASAGSARRLRGPGTRRGTDTPRQANSLLIGHQPRSGAQIHVHPRTSTGIGWPNRRLFVPESSPLRNQEVGGSSPPSSIICLVACALFL